MYSVNSVDLLLISCPSKVIDYPSLSLPALTGFLKSNDIIVSQKDLNIEIKDRLIKKSNLDCLYKTIIPLLLRLNMNNVENYTKLQQLYYLLEKVNNSCGFEKLEEIKEKCQRREYDFLKDKPSSDILTSVFMISRSCDYIFSFIYLYFPLIIKNDIYLFLIDYIDVVTKEIVKIDPLIVGLSMITTQNNFTLWFASYLKKNNYDGYILLGGAQPTKFEGQYIYDNPAVDFVIFGEGEYPILKLINELKNRDPQLNKIPRLIFRSLDGIIKNSNQKYLEESYKATFPNYDGFPLERYLSPVFPILASSNCPWKKCKFCAHRTSFREDYHERDPVNVVDEMEYMYIKYGARLFHFADETINAEQGAQIGELILQRQLPFFWMSFGRLDEEFNEENISRWHKGGARVVEWGLESAADEVLINMNKGINVKKAQEILQIAGSMGIKNKLLTWHNYPGESLEDLVKTINFVRKNVQEGYAAPMLTLKQKLVLQAGSELYNETFLDQKESKLFEKVWLPASIYSINASYFNLNHCNKEKQALIIPYIKEMEDYCYSNDIFIASNENVSFDLIFYQLKEG